MLNLDREAVDIAQGLLEGAKGKEFADLDRVLTKSLGVLSESGVYALFVYLLAKRKKKEENDKKFDPYGFIVSGLLKELRAKDTLCKTLCLEGEVPILSNQDTDVAGILRWVSSQVNDLNRLLLLRDFLLRVLTYGRYIAQARKVEAAVGQTPEGGATA